MHPERKYWPTDDIRRYFDDPSFEVPGQPNYRNRPGRSGLDPIDYQFEYAHIQGRIVRMLLDGKWFTDNPIYVMILILAGLLSLLGLVATVLSPILQIAFISPFCLIPFVLYFLIVPPLIMRFYRLQDSLDDEDEDWDEDEFDV